MRKFIVIGALLSISHLFLTLASIAAPIFLGDSLKRFDNPDLPVTTTEEIANYLSSILVPILVEPMEYIKHTLHLEPNSTILALLLFLLNSLFWGFCLTFLLFAFHRRSNERM